LLYETDNRYICEYIPAHGYDILTSEAIADKIYSIDRSAKIIKGTIEEIRLYYTKTREELPRTRQPSFNVVDQVYRLKAEISGFLFTVRSIMDLIATMMHFLYGPESRIFVSFNDFIKQAVH